jgi:hypothetical protein
MGAQLQQGINVVAVRHRAGSTTAAAAVQQVRARVFQHCELRLEIQGIIDK